MQNIYYYESPIGILKISIDKEYITGVYLQQEKSDLNKEVNNSLASLCLDVCGQFNEYFYGTRTAFDLPIKFTSGTPFQHSVWNALRDIPYGETRSYEDIARAIGNPKAVRAIGQANTHNPILLLVPCHRVINKNGTIGGFGCGVEVKRKLLELEGVTVK